MSNIKLSADISDIIYTYDGSFEGFLCCVFESVYSKETPYDILPESDVPLTLMDTKVIVTDHDKASRVHKSIPNKISKKALNLVCTVFLSCLPQKELKILAFLFRGYKEGSKLLNKLGDPVVAPLLAAELHLLREAHNLKGFIRFSDIGEALVSTITPKNYVLPFLANHFTLRYDNENFMIFDKTHKAALVYQNRKSEIISIDDLELPPISEKEEMYQSLWKQFYNTISIESRENPRCRMTHMPKRYWENMLEVKSLL
ncbi:MAG: TIGR03915 family putative DNA repair protein [Defluviitaleaceae bacterium]|nr:TIGR03915 family putative DNA repair protein [Defluviitaleaceae bacterium]